MNNLRKRIYNEMRFSVIALLVALGTAGFPGFAEPETKLSEIDSNFKIEELGGKKYKFHDFTQKPFALCGFAWYDKEHKLRRFPENVITDPTVNNGAKHLSRHTSGGMIRFKTDSKSIAVRATLLSSGDMSHMARSGSSGFDLYTGSGSNKKYVKTAMPKANSDKVETVLFNAPKAEMREFTINLPLYNGIKELAIGLDPECKIEEPSPFKYQKPVVFYGSSITQGGCASRPGNDYPHILSRWLDFELVNLGFSGSAKGEPAVAEAIAALDPEALIIDYDHNAPSAEHLEKTHEKFFRIIREKHPDLPIVIISRPGEYGPTDQRFMIIKKTYDNAVAAGDRHVYMVPGYTLFGTKDRDACTVDGCHPNDLGFMRMAETVRPVLEKALQKE